MKRISALLLITVLLTCALCGCGKDTGGSTSGNKTSASSVDGAGSADESGKDGDTTASGNLPKAYEIAATDPHYITCV